MRSAISVRLAPAGRALYSSVINARTKVSPSGDVPIPKDVRDRLGWGPHTDLELVETADGVRLRAAASTNAFPRKALRDLEALAPLGPPQPTEAISRLSDEDLRHLLKC